MEDLAGAAVGAAAAAGGAAVAVGWWISRQRDRLRPAVVPPSRRSPRRR